MNDDERFERDLRDAVLRGVPATAPRALRDRVAAIPATATAAEAGGRRGATRRWILVAAAAAVLVVAVTGTFLATQPQIGPAATSPAITPGPTGPVVTSAPAVTPSPSATPRPTLAVGPEVDQFDLLDGTHGWAISADSLYMTDDGGATWRWLRSVPVGSASSVTFADPDHGWLVVWPTGDLLEMLAVDRTSDGGRTWQRVTIPAGRRGAFMRLAFSDALHGVLAVDDATSATMSPGILWATADGGATWSRVGALPPTLIDGVRFSDPGTLWALGSTMTRTPAAARASKLFVSRDGGRTWQVVSLPAPPAELGGTATLELPRALDSSRDLLLERLSFAANLGPTEVLLSHDGGASWSVGATIETGFATGIVVLGPQHWLTSIGSAADPAPLHETLDGGRTWRPIATAGLPNDHPLLSLDFVDSKTGWASADSSDQGGLPMQLYATSDGGATWRLLRPTGAPAPTKPPCSVTANVLGPTPGLTLGADTPWFNVFPADVDTTSPLTVEFDVPVIPWSSAGAPPSGPVYHYVEPVDLLRSGKFTFRPADPSATQITVTITGAGCTASTTVDLAAASPSP
jgi:photosystem II stability/assembly factor-like uncharacterized protein